MAYSIIKPKRGTAIQWTNANPILREGEMGVEVCSEGVGKGTCKIKFGDGITPWVELPYAICPSAYFEDIDSEGLVTSEQFSNLETVVNAHSESINNLIDKSSQIETNKNTIENLTSQQNIMNQSLNNNIVQTNNALSNAFAHYSHSKTDNAHYLVGNGSNIRFFATADWNPGDILFINGVLSSCYNQLTERIENDVIFKKNATVTCHSTTAGTECFFKLGGGVSNSDLAKATATPDVVKSGYTFFAGSKELLTGTMLADITHIITAKEKSKDNTTWTSTITGNVLAVFSSGMRSNSTPEHTCTSNNPNTEIVELCDHYQVNGSAQYDYSCTGIAIYLIKGVVEGDILSFTTEKGSTSAEYYQLDILQIS